MTTTFKSVCLLLGMVRMNEMQSLSLRWWCSTFENRHVNSKTTFHFRNTVIAMLQIFKMYYRKTIDSGEEDDKRHLRDDDM